MLFKKKPSIINKSKGKLIIDNRPKNTKSDIPKNRNEDDSIESFISNIEGLVRQRNDLRNHLKEINTKISLYNIYLKELDSHNPTVRSVSYEQSYNSFIKIDISNVQNARLALASIITAEINSYKISRDAMKAELKRVEGILESISKSTKGEIKDATTESKSE